MEKRERKRCGKEGEKEMWERRRGRNVGKKERCGKDGGVEMFETGARNRCETEM